MLIRCQVVGYSRPTKLSPSIYLSVFMPPNTKRLGPSENAKTLKNRLNITAFNQGNYYLGETHESWQDELRKLFLTDRRNEITVLIFIYPLTADEAKHITKDNLTPKNKRKFVASLSGNFNPPNCINQQKLIVFEPERMNDVTVNQLLDQMSEESLEMPELDDRLQIEYTPLLTTFSVHLCHIFKYLYLNHRGRGNHYSQNLARVIRVLHHLLAKSNALLTTIMAIYDGEQLVILSYLVGTLQIKMKKNISDKGDLTQLLLKARKECTKIPEGVKAKSYIAFITDEIEKYVTLVCPEAIVEARALAEWGVRNYVTGFAREVNTCLREFTWDKERGLEQLAGPARVYRLGFCAMTSSTFNSGRLFQQRFDSFQKEFADLFSKHWPLASLIKSFVNDHALPAFDKALIYYAMGMNSINREKIYDQLISRHLGRLALTEVHRAVDEDKRFEGHLSDLTKLIFLLIVASDGYLLDLKALEHCLATEFSDKLNLHDDYKHYAKTITWETCFSSTRLTWMSNNGPKFTDTTMVENKSLAQKMGSWVVEHSLLINQLSIYATSEMFGFVISAVFEALQMNVTVYAPDEEVSVRVQTTYTRIFRGHTIGFYSPLCDGVSGVCPDSDADLDAESVDSSTSDDDSPTVLEDSSGVDDDDTEHSSPEDDSGAHDDDIEHSSPENDSGADDDDIECLYPEDDLPHIECKYVPSNPRLGC